jgi:hypothetical protein
MNGKPHQARNTDLGADGERAEVAGAVDCPHSELVLRRGLSRRTTPSELVMAFVNRTASDFHVSPASPASMLLLPPTSSQPTMPATPRPQGLRPDIAPTSVDPTATERGPRTHRRYQPLLPSAAGKNRLRKERAAMFPDPTSSPAPHTP